MLIGGATFDRCLVLFRVFSWGGHDAIQRRLVFTQAGIQSVSKKRHAFGSTSTAASRVRGSPQVVRCCQVLANRMPRRPGTFGKPQIQQVHAVHTRPLKKSSQCRLGRPLLRGQTASCRWDDEQEHAPEVVTHGDARADGGAWGFAVERKFVVAGRTRRRCSHCHEWPGTAESRCVTAARPRFQAGSHKQWNAVGRIRCHTLLGRRLVNAHHQRPRRCNGHALLPRPSKPR